MPAVVVSSVLLAIVCVVRAFVAPTTIDIVGASRMPLAEWLEGVGSMPALYVVLVVLAVVCCMVNVLSTSIYSIARGRRTTFPLLVWTLAGCGVVFPAQSLSAFVAAFVMTVALKNVARSFKRSYSFGAVFSSSFALGLLPLLHAPFVVVYAALPVVWTLTRRTLRELVVGVVGALMPLLSVAYILWIKGYGFGYLFSLLSNEAFGHDYKLLAGVGSMQGVALVMWLLVAVICMVVSLAGSATLRAKPRTMAYVHSLVLVALLLTLTMGGGTFMMIPTAAVCVALLSPNVFGRRLADYASILFLAFAIVVVFYNLGLLF